MLTLNAQSAKSADNQSTSIRTSGKYIGTITRAEKLLSQNGTAGLGISFKSHDGQTADYLDLYTINGGGAELPSSKIVHAILAVLKMRTCKEGKINFEKWSATEKKKINAQADGYPDLMDKKIGFLLQKELYSDFKDGSDRDRMIVVGVFNADNDLTASETLDGKTTPEKLPSMVNLLMDRPVRDSSKKGASQAKPAQGYQGGTGMPDDFGSDIPF